MPRTFRSGGESRGSGGSKKSGGGAERQKKVDKAWERHNAREKKNAARESFGFGKNASADGPGY